MMTLEFGLIKTCRFPRFSAFTMLFKQSRSTLIRTIFATGAPTENRWLGLDPRFAPPPFLSLKRSWLESVPHARWLDLSSTKTCQCLQAKRQISPCPRDIQEVRQQSVQHYQISWLKWWHEGRGISNSNSSSPILFYCWSFTQLLLRRLRFLPDLGHTCHNYNTYSDPRIFRLNWEAPNGAVACTCTPAPRDHESCSILCVSTLLRLQV